MTTKPQKIEGGKKDWICDDTLSGEMPSGDRRNEWFVIEEGKQKKANFINWLIKFLKVDTNKISDGYHTFEELYDHRIALWIALCEDHCDSWKSRTHSDGSKWDGWFIMGIYSDKGKQLTYHLPDKYWKRCEGIPTLSKAPEYDGHTPNDVIKRLKTIWI